MYRALNENDKTGSLYNNYYFIIHGVGGRWKSFGQ